MGAKSAIEWTDSSWTPIRARYDEIQNDGSGRERVGWHCQHVSDGCRNCYAEAINRRLGTGRDFAPDELYREARRGYRNGEVHLFLDEKMLLAPLRWHKPRRIFVCSMTDLFAEFVTDDMIDRVLAMAALCPGHTFQVLTKRATRMRDYMLTPQRKQLIARHVMAISEMLAVERGRQARITLDHFSACFAGAGPFQNVWLGVSVEDQTRADERIPHLLETPAALRFLSCEPRLGSIDLARIVERIGQATIITFNALAHPDTLNRGRNRQGIDWVIVGGESGPGARSFDLAWARDIVRQCKAAGVACFVKQIGRAPVDSARCVEGDAPAFPAKDKKGGDWNEWPADLRVREFPGDAAPQGAIGRAAR